MRGEYNCLIEYCAICKAHCSRFARGSRRVLLEGLISSTCVIFIVPLVSPVHTMATCLYENRQASEHVRRPFAWPTHVRSGSSGSRSIVSYSVTSVHVHARTYQSWSCHARLAARRALRPLLSVQEKWRNARPLSARVVLQRRPGLA